MRLRLPELRHVVKADLPILFIARAGRLVRSRGGKTVLRISDNPATKQLYEEFCDALAA